jgi:hypothetical protein
MELIARMLVRAATQPRPRGLGQNLYRKLFARSVSVMGYSTGQNRATDESQRRRNFLRGHFTYMRIAKPILMVTTPIGVLDGFYECYKLAGGLVFLMVAMVGVLGVALATVVATIRRESAAAAKEDRCQS